MTDTEIRALAYAIAARLFVNGAGQQANRLVLVSKEGRDLGGWAESAAADQIEKVIREAAQEKGKYRENSKRCLPQASDLEDIDFTGGLNPTEYIRRLRGDKSEYCAVCKSSDPALCIAIRYGVHDQDRDDRPEECECSCHEDSTDDSPHIYGKNGNAS